MSLDTELHGEIDPEDVGSNTSNNRPFADVLAARVSRRGLVRGGTLVAAAGFLAAGGALAGPAVAAETTTAARRRKPLLGFTPIAPNVEDAVTVPDGYYTQVLIPWGEPIRPGGSAWKRDASNTAAEQEQQIGMHHDANCYFPIRGRDENRRGVLVTNHEYTDNTLLYTDGNAVMTQEKVDKALAAHGVSIVEIALGSDGTWRVVDSKYARRITGNTPVSFSGPVPVDHPMLQSAPGQGNLEQLLVRRDSVGHVPRLRGELQRVLRHRRPDVDPGRP